MKFDTIVIDCSRRKHRRKPIVKEQIFWKTDRNMMLKYDNVVVDGPTVTIKNLQSRNTGNYSCTMVRGRMYIDGIKTPQLNIKIFNSKTSHYRTMVSRYPHLH